MKKNLKKVISAVLSLTLALSSMVALSATSSAATFTDVADTASYSEAVEALAALGAIAGYEDGTFLPNNNITRAEVSTMIVAALNMSEDAKNSGSTTQFADVNANAAWAAGYVNVGVAQGFISGMSATEFAPAENVTYAQVLSMLTRILGYSEFAEARGGWPNGYLNAASTAGILTGVSASVNDAMTRAQVAQLIWNTLQAPVLDITTYSTSLTGSEMEKMDGKNGRDFRTVLSDKYDAYVLNITVDETSKSNSTLDAGKINMSLTASNDWDPDSAGLVKDLSNKKKSDVSVGKTDAENYLFSSAKVIAEFNDDDEWTLLYFAPTSKVTQREVDGTLVAEQTASNPGVAADYIRIRKSKTSSTTTNYRLTDDAKLYVNGVEYFDIAGTTGTGSDAKANTDITRAILEASTGNTVLVESQDRSGYYDKVMVDFYAIARVTQVNAKSDETTLTLNNVKTTPFSTSGAKIVINADDIETGDKTVSVTKANAAAELTSLAKDDVVAIKYNVKEATLDDSAFFEIIATADTVTGKYSGYDDEDEVYTVDGTNYEASASQNLDLETGVTYTFYLDPFGAIFTYDEEASTKNFAIVERFVDINEVSSSSSEYSYIQVMTLDGQSKTLYIDNNNDATVRAALKDMGHTGSMSVAKTAKDIDIKDRIIEYTVRNSTGRINKVEKVTDIVEVEGESYKQASNRLSRSLASTAAVLDATDYDVQNAKTSDYKASSLAGLTDNVDYDGYLVYRNSNGEYAYVIITSAGATFGADSNFVVAATNASTSSQTSVEGEDVYTLRTMMNGNDSYENLNVSTSVVVYYGENSDGKAHEINYSDIKKGSVFYYTTDSDGFVDEIYVVMMGTENFNDLLKVTDMTSAIKLPGGDKTIKAEDWGITLDDKQITGDTEIQLVLAPVVKTSSNTVTVAPVYAEGDKYYFEMKGDEVQFNVRSDANIYSYDMSGRLTGSNAFANGSFNGSISNRDLVNNEKGYLIGASTDEQDFGDTIQMAFLMVVEGTVTNALVFNN